MAYNYALIGIQTPLIGVQSLLTGPPTNLAIFYLLCMQGDQACNYLAITLLGVPKALFGIQCQTLYYRLMSRQKLVPVDPERQPPIRTFVSECRKAGLAGATG